MRADRHGKPAPSWHLLHHGVVGAALGFPWAVCLSGLLFHGLGDPRDPATYQVAMWSVVPLWATALALAFLARSPLACWAWGLAANAFAFALLHGVAP
ncbi:hypothetical protein [Eleftheria terrae]|uniref:hypothetical protein n=1 Tax=Eleftheria terrae TaxID=1597781 RepID=UPI00263B84CB|nr:hypothetical protein [Eleftheria terrae]WKB55727.1 hypothetical protein N7L95_27040 [Eleftheria terrae]